MVRLLGWLLFGGAGEAFDGLFVLEDASGVPPLAVLAFFGIFALLLLAAGDALRFNDFGATGAMPLGNFGIGAVGFVPELCVPPVFDGVTIMKFAARSAISRSMAGDGDLKDDWVSCS